MKKNLKKIKVQTKNLIKISVTMLAVTVMFYVYLVNAATFNTAKAQSMSEQVGILQSEISDLELSYIDKTRSISVNQAADFALVPNQKTAKKILVARDNSTKLTLNIQ
jgi:hypothetical protein